MYKEDKPRRLEL